MPPFATRKFIPNPAFVALMEKEPTYLAAMSTIADLVAEEAREIAPQPGSGHPYATGAYRDSIRTSGSTVGAGDDEAWYAWILEYGSVDTPAFATLRTAVKNLGLGLIEDHTESDLPGTIV